MEKINPLQVNNELLTSKFDLSERATDVLFLIWGKISQLNKGQEIATTSCDIETRSLLDAANVNSKVRLTEIVDELTRLRFKTRQGNLYMNVPFCSGYVTDGEIFTFEISRLFLPYMLQFIHGYAAIHVPTLWKLKGKYSKRMYLDVCRWNTAGVMHINFDDLRSRYDCERYTNFDLLQRVINPALEEINNSTLFSVFLTDEKKSGKKLISQRYTVRKRQSRNPKLYNMLVIRGISQPVAVKICELRTDVEILAVIQAAENRKFELGNMAAYIVSQLYAKEPEPETSVYETKNTTNPAKKQQASF